MRIIKEYLQVQAFGIPVKELDELEKGGFDSQAVRAAVLASGLAIADADAIVQKVEEMKQKLEGTAVVRRPQQPWGVKYFGWLPEIGKRIVANARAVAGPLMVTLMVMVTIILIVATAIIVINKSNQIEAKTKNWTSLHFTATGPSSDYSAQADKLVVKDEEMKPAEPEKVEPEASKPEVAPVVTPIAEKDEEFEKKTVEKIEAKTPAPKKIADCLEAEDGIVNASQAYACCGNIRRGKEECLDRLLNLPVVRQ